jgi:hypothetical protein
MSNAVEARKVVFELFQDLDGFRLDDYKAMGNPEEVVVHRVLFPTLLFDVAPFAALGFPLRRLRAGPVATWAAAKQ